MIVSYYSEEAYAAHVAQPGVQAVLVKGGKWDGLYKTLTAEGIDLSAYDYIWLPDDDIDTNGEAIETIFGMAYEHGLTVCQPSLTPQSYFSHFLLIQCAAFRLRYTNYIEIMVPCLSREVLLRALPLFKNTMSGFGLDYIWCRWPESGAFRCAILDEVAVFHTRPVGKHLKAAMTGAGLSAKGEEGELKEHFGLRGRVVPVAYAAIAADGTPVTGRYRIGRKMVAYWLENLTAFRDRGEAWRKAIQILKRQYVKKVEMTILKAREPA
ncbi:hypothetical protein [Rhizobium oryzicola]|uniref:DUF707 domain-containing protein n=1 Tax=Rhizobium oryzicola TaxID=1232668 RepID=A0ABT8SQH1_9HYPH|nr:hypothetical protein [Rhizobium oryzicola]MDO1580721.1 hypothetical protein [Rhizobium oryzicola]